MSSAEPCGFGNCDKRAEWHIEMGDGDGAYCTEHRDWIQEDYRADPEWSTFEVTPISPEESP